MSEVWPAAELVLYSLSSATRAPSELSHQHSEHQEQSLS